jgi:hypothetical protein
VKTVFLLQLRDHLTSLRCQLSLGLLLLFFVANGVTYSWKMERLGREQRLIEAENQRRYEGIGSVDQAVGRACRVASRALGTEFVSEGGANWLADAVEVPVGTGAGFLAATNLLTTNHWLRRFDVVDWTLVVRLVLSFLAVVLAYDSISGEAESGTLRQALANPIGRGRYLTGKLLAHLAVLLGGVLVGMLLGLLILSLSGVLVLDGQAVQAALFFVGAAAALAALFLGLSLAVSSLAPDSTTALVVLVMAWAGLVVLAPQASYPLAVHLVPVTTDVRGRQDQVIADARQGLAGQGIGLRGPEAGRVDGFALEREYGRRLEAAQAEAEEIGREADRQALRRYSVARAVNLLSPGFAFQYSVEALLGTGIARRERFLTQARQYREEIRAFLREQDAADPESPHVLYVAGYLSQRPLAAAAIPRFREQRPSLAERVAAGAVPLVILTLEAAVGVLFALWAFNRRDLTQG